MELRGSTALLTGAAGGLGGHIARGLSAEGVKLALSDLSAEPLEARAGEVRDSGGRAEAVPADLLDASQRDSLVERAEQVIGPIDLLVNNAGVEATAPLIEFSEEEIDRSLAVNLRAPMALIRAAVPGMLERGRGHVVSVASLAAKFAPAYMAPYAVAKAGLVALTQALRAEHSDEPVGFSVICPGFVAGEGMTEILLRNGTEIPASFGSSPPELVPRAVIRCVERDLPEVVITHRRPTRLVMALQALAPRGAERLLAATGAPYVFRTTTERRGRLPRG